MLRVLLLLLKALLERRQAGDNTANHEHQTNDRPDDAPALRGPAVALGEDAGIGGIYFPQYEIVADVPDGVEAGHYADEELIQLASSTSQDKER